MPHSVRRIWRFVLDHSILLLAGTALAVVWANVDAPSYERATRVLHVAVNDVGMAFFFALAAKEVVEATAPGGVLHSRRRAAMPLLAAVGGMAAPAAVFVAIALASGERSLARGWAIPCATDIAFSYLIAAAAFGRRHPAIPFLLLLAIADDALGLAILAVFYPAGPLRPVDFLVLLAAGMGIAFALRKRRVGSFWPYLAGPGSLSWLAFSRGGLHPALALVPIIPFLPHASRDPGLFVRGSTRPQDPLTELERWWTVPVQIILFLFGLVNAGVPLPNTGPGTWIVLAAILLGKPIGIVSFTAIGGAMGLRRPAGVTWRDLVVAGCAAAIGFTVALFFATAAFPPGALLDQTKMGALLSVVAAPLTAAAAWMLKVGRWSARERPPATGSR